MTDDDRPFTKDFQDLFSTLIISLPLEAHRVRFTKIVNTFTSEEAIQNLASLKFSQSHRMPDPKDPSRIVTTTTTTTFSMAREMARSTCQRFLDARFIEPVDGRPNQPFTLKGGLWQLTPKGIAVLHRFCTRNGISSRHIDALLKKDQMHLVILERDFTTDKLSQDRGTIEVIFRRFIGTEGPNIKASAQAADTESLSDYSTGVVGVKMAKDRQIFKKSVSHSFTGKAASDWLLDCCSTIDRNETVRICEMFVKQGLMWPVVEDKLFEQQHPECSVFQPSRQAIYGLTEHGQRVCGWISRTSNDSEDSREPRRENRSKDSNTNKLIAILAEPPLRLLFREFLRQSLCEENLSFYIDVREFMIDYKKLDQVGAFAEPSQVREKLAAAYSESCPVRL